MTDTTLTVMQARVLPDTVEAELNDIAEDAMHAAYKVIAGRLNNLGYPVSGDIHPGEAETLDNAFRTFVRMMALNNGDIAQLQDAAAGRTWIVGEAIRRMEHGIAEWEAGRMTSPSERDYVLDTIEAIQAEYEGFEDVDNARIDGIATLIYADHGETFSQSFETLAPWIVGRLLDDVEPDDHLTHTSPALLAALSDFKAELLHTGGGCMVATVNLGRGRQVWLTREEDWLLGFYDFGADPEDEGLCVSLLAHRTAEGGSTADDPAWVAGQVGGIIKRLHVEP